MTERASLPEPGPRELAERLLGRRAVVLTGAGVSTESGIPDYRSPESLKRTRKPIQGPEFARSASLRRRYWARAMAGWERFRNAEPGAAHRAIAELESRSIAIGVITQNVDRLHARAGSRNVVELHGALADVVCLECRAFVDRDSLQARMRLDNPSWIDGPTPMAPDGDSELDAEMIEQFIVPACEACGGALKPRVVFFGDNVAREVVDRAFAMLDEADVLLVAGTSLAVFSGYRFLRRAAERKMDVVIVNRGPVRGEEHASLKIERSTGEVLASAARLLG